MSVAIPRQLYKTVAIVAALVLVFASVLTKLGRDWWSDENYSHGLLIPFVIGYILWQERKQFRQAQKRPAIWFGALGVGFALLMLIAIGAATSNPATDACISQGGSGGTCPGGGPLGGVCFVLAVLGFGYGVKLWSGRRD